MPRLNEEVGVLRVLQPQARALLDADRRELAEEDRSLILDAIRAHLADG